MTNTQQKIEYKEKTIPYELKRAKIKNLYIYIKNGKVIIKAPMKLKNKNIYEFIDKKKEWIYNNIKKQQEKIKAEEEEKIEPQDIKKLETIVEKSIDKYSKLLEIMPNKVKIKNIKYAWGSCSSKKNISINAKLAKKNEKAIEYVVLHEMCHLKQMNHSKKFWNLVERYMPEYKEYKKMLK